MRIETFAKLVSLEDKTELEKVELLAFYYLENKDQAEFRVGDMSAVLVGLGYAKPNETRLRSRLGKSSSFIKGTRQDFFRLSPKKRREHQSVYPNLSESEEIISDDSVLPEVLFSAARRAYLMRAAKQINATYEHHLFDACSLMMRRLLEILLIHCFEEAGIEDQVKDADGTYQGLKTLINKVKSSAEIKLSADAGKEIDAFRELGNLAAHRVKYTCRRDDIRHDRIQYRAIVEELLYVSGLVGR